MNQPTVSKTDLSKVFGSVVQVLQENRQSLNAADEYNHNHGDNMVDTFQVIANSMKQKQTSSPSTQLAYASQQLSKQAQSGSAQLYSQGLAQAAQKVKGQTRISPETAMTLVQALMGGQSAPAAPQAQSQGGMQDLLGALMGGQSAPAAQPQSQGGLDDLMGALLGGQSPTHQSNQPDAGDLLGSLLGGQQAPSSQGQSSGMGDLLGSLLGGQAAQPQSQGPQSQGQGGGIDLNTLLAAGMAFFQARQKGAGALQAIVQAVMAGSQMNSSSHRQQSGQLVAGTLLNALGSVMSGAK